MTKIQAIFHSEEHISTQAITLRFVAISCWEIYTGKKINSTAFYQAAEFIFYRQQTGIKNSRKKILRLKK